MRARHLLRTLPGLAGFVLVFLPVTRAGLAAQPARTAPAPQSAHCLVYDERLQRIVLVSGHDGGARPDAADVWTFDGRRWERVLRPDLPSRFLAGAAYDSVRNRLVVFGGRVGAKGVQAADTWEWDGRSWRERQDAGVGSREHHSMTYDQRRRRTVMFGGTAVRVGPTETAAARTWPAHVSEWDGETWRPVHASGPGARNGTAIAYDPRRSNVVLFGGVGEDGAYRSGTWTWDGRTWTRAAAADPPLRATHQMAFDSRSGVLLLYGGGHIQDGRAERRADMWQWDGARWTEVAMRGPTPGPRVGHAMAYDGARGRLVLFGGFTEGSARKGDTWEWDGARWTEIP